MKENEYLLIAARNNAIRTNYIKAKIYNRQQSSKWRLLGNSDKTGNRVSEYSKLAQKKYKSRYDWTGKVIHWELCKRLKFHHTNKGWVGLVGFYGISTIVGYLIHFYTYKHFYFKHFSLA